MKIAIVGAGYAGLAAAVTLAEHGVGADVFEASKVLGGRARAVDIQEQALDNGMHIMIGAYRETLRLLRLVGVRENEALYRSRLRLELPGRLRLAAPLLPAPLHLAWALLRAHGLTPSEKNMAIRFIGDHKRTHFRLPADRPVSELLQCQPPRLRRLFWEPLCLATLNTPPETASAQVFLNVLRDSLAGKRAASDLLLPARDLSRMFPEPAAAYITARGGQVRRGRRIAGIRRGPAGFAIDGFGPYDQAILAVAPQHLPRLVSGLPAMEPVAGLVLGFDYQSITTCYLSYPHQVGLPFPMLGADSDHYQWLFDRGRLCRQPGLLAGVISGNGPHDRMDPPALAEELHRTLAMVAPKLPPPHWSKVIRERRATFACHPNLRRPETATPVPGLYLAGDYVAGDYPATLEGAIRSGIAAARAALGRRPGSGNR